VVNGVWQGQRQIFALRTICTHLGCVTIWQPSQRRFKCPCHGSGFYADGRNFEGPAPRALDRAAIRLADDGQLEIDTSRTFQAELGQWNDRVVRAGLKKCTMTKIRNGQLWKSIFRHPAPKDRPNRVAVMLSSVVLHLHPVAIPKHALRLRYTWCMGGITAFLFLVETITGVLLMFYYRPTVQWAYHDVLSLRDAVSFGVLREVHPGAPTPRSSPSGSIRSGSF